MKYSLFLAIAAASWGLNFHLAHQMLQYSSPLEGGFWRYAFGVGALILFTIKIWPSWTIIKPYLWHLFLIGFVGLFIFNYLFFLGLTYTSGVNAALIISLNPALTLIFSKWMLGTRINKNHYLGILVAFIGVVILILKGNLSNFHQLSLNQGDGWIMLANTIFALHHVWIKKYTAGLRNTYLTVISNLFCFLGFVLVLPFYGIGDFTEYPSIFWLNAFGIGVMGTAVAYFLWNIGVRNKGPATAGVFMNVVPLATGVFATAFGEIIQVYHLTSGSIIILGILIMQSSSLRAKLQR